MLLTFKFVVFAALCCLASCNPRTPTSPVAADANSGGWTWYSFKERTPMRARPASARSGKLEQKPFTLS